jgi:hypothetical protein
MIKVDEKTFRRMWAGTSLVPALLMWGMRHGQFNPSGGKLSVAEISLRTGWACDEIESMLRTVDNLLISETDNEIADSSGRDMR